jgi:hypothetical protein
MAVDEALITIVYAVLLAWGVFVAFQLIWQGLRRPEALLNPLFANRHALRLFTWHIVVVSLDLFVIGPLALANKSALWYWGGRIATLSSSMALIAYLNRTPQSFGKLVGRWIVFRNVFEVTLHVAAAAAVTTNWFHLYMLHWWIVAYRYLDVGPRRLLQKLYDSPEKLAARRWAPVLNWMVIVLLYVAVAFAVYFERVLFAVVPDEGRPEHVSRPLDVVLVVVYNLAVAVLFWVGSKKYTESLLHEAGVEKTPLPEEVHPGH